jgi:hypothetical protein
MREKGDKTMCDSCEAVRINGVLCHEHGCPEAWRDHKIECRECGTRFVPEVKGQQFCDDDCYRTYNGIPNPDDHFDPLDEE